MTYASFTKFMSNLRSGYVLYIVTVHADSNLGDTRWLLNNFVCTILLTRLGLMHCLIFSYIPTIAPQRFIFLTTRESLWDSNTRGIVRLEHDSHGRNCKVISPRPHIHIHSSNNTAWFWKTILIFPSNPFFAWSINKWGKKSKKKSNCIFKLPLQSSIWDSCFFFWTIRQSEFTCSVF